MSRTHVYLTLTALVAVSAVLHFARIADPAQPVFDEAYFATYAADYITGTAFPDIHPPLGKLLYAGVLKLTPERGSGETQFIQNRAARTGPGRQVPISIGTNRPFGNFPYTFLRMLSALFGIALVPLIYFFMRSLGANNVASLLAAGLLTLENAFLLQTRLVLLDGMFIFFGLLALTLFFYRRPPILSGITWGLALSVKLTAVVFIGPVIIFWWLCRRQPGLTQKALIFIGAGLLLCILSFSLNGLFFTPAAQVAAWADSGVFPPSYFKTPFWQNLTPDFRGYAITTLLQVFISAVEYTDLSFGHPFGSSWYFWPLGQIPMPYFIPNAGGGITFANNPVVSVLAFGAVIYALVYLLKKVLLRKTGGQSFAIYALLAGGYLSNLLPYATFVHRVTFLYHYLPGLLFGLCAAGQVIGETLNTPDGVPRTRRRKIVLAGIGLLVVAGFLFRLKTTYGL